MVYCIPNLFINLFILVIYLPFHQNFCNILPGGRHPAGPTKLINLLIFWSFPCLEGGIRLLNSLKRRWKADWSAFQHQTTVEGGVRLQTIKKAMSAFQEGDLRLL